MTIVNFDLTGEGGPIDVIDRIKVGEVAAVFPVRDAAHSSVAS